MAITRRIAVVGLGSIGRRHARLLHERDDVSVELVEPDPETLDRAEREIGSLPFHKSFEEMLKKKPEMVLIATPHNLHASQTIQALNAGIHVLCEKPMSDNLADAAGMKEAAEKSGKVLNIGFNLHFHPGLKLLKEAISDGTLGNVIHAHARVGTYITLANSISHYQSDMQGALLLDYAHQPDILYWLLEKKPVAVYASGLEAGELEYSSHPNVIAVNCEYQSPLLTTIHLNYIQMPQRHEYEIVGDHGWAVLDVDAGTLRTGLRQARSVQTESFDTVRDQMYITEHQAFLDAVDGKRKPESSAADSMISLAVCEAALKSWKTHQRVEVQL